MDAYIDVVAGELRALILPEAEIRQPMHAGDGHSLRTSELEMVNNSVADAPVPPTSPRPESEKEWQEKWDPTNQRFFYLNKRTKESMWTLPESTTVEFASRWVPAADGSDGFQNVDTGETSPTNPDEPQPAKRAFSTLHVDETGTTYYVNTKTGDATWDDPEKAAAEADKAEADRASTAKKSSARIRRFSQVKKDPVGNTYFVNNKTGESTWEDPEARSLAEGASQGAQQPAAVRFAEADSPHNRPMPYSALVAILCAFCSMSLATCWIAITADVGGLVGKYGRDAALVMQLGYNLPVLPIVIMQKNLGDAACRKLGTRGFVVAQAVFAFVGNGCVCLLWKPIMMSFGAAQTWHLFLLSLLVGWFSATGYGAFLFAVRLFDNRAKSWFVKGFNCGGLVNLGIMVGTGKGLPVPWAGPTTKPLYFTLAGFVVAIGFVLAVILVYGFREVRIRFEQHDQKVHGLDLTSRDDVDKLSLPATVTRFGLWPTMAATTINFLCSVAMFSLIPFVPSVNCLLPIILTYTQIFTDVAGQYYPVQISNQSIALGILAPLRVLLLAAFVILLHQPDLMAADATVQNVAGVLVGLSMFSGGVMMRANFAISSSAAAKSAGKPVLAKGVAAVSFFVFMGSYLGFIVGGVIAYTQLNPGWFPAACGSSAMWFPSLTPSA